MHWAEVSIEPVSGDGQDAVGLVKINREGFRRRQGNRRAVIPPANQGVSGDGRSVIVKHGISERTEASSCSKDGVSTASQLEGATGLGAGDGADGQATRGVTACRGQFSDVGTNRMSTSVGCSVSQSHLQHMGSAGLELVNCRCQVLDELVVFVK